MFVLSYLSDRVQVRGVPSAVVGASGAIAVLYLYIYVYRYRYIYRERVIYTAAFLSCAGAWRPRGRGGNVRRDCWALYYIYIQMYIYIYRYIYVYMY